MSVMETAEERYYWGEIIYTDSTVHQALLELFDEVVEMCYPIYIEKIGVTIKFIQF